MTMLKIICGEVDCQMRMTVFNVETQLYEADHYGIEFLENIIQKLGIIEDIMEDHGIFSILELKERLDSD